MEKIMTAKEWLIERDKIPSEAQVVIKNKEIVGCDLALVEEYVQYRLNNQKAPMYAEITIEGRIRNEYNKYKNSDNIDFIKMAAIKLKQELWKH